MIIVSGKIFVIVGMRDLFLKKSLDTIKTARETKGCRDFVVAADPIDQNRINVYEAWESEVDLAMFRGTGPPSDINALIKDAQVNEYIVTSKGS